MVPASRTCTIERPDEIERRKRSDEETHDVNSCARRENSAAALFEDAPEKPNSFFSKSTPCAAPRPGRHFCSETDRQAAKDGTPVSHVSTGACGRPSVGGPDNEVAEASTDTERLTPNPWSPLLGPAPSNGQTRLRDESAGTY